MRKKSSPEIPECPAFELCRERGVGCEACLELSVEAWREHVVQIRAAAELVP